MTGFWRRGGEEQPFDAVSGRIVEDAEAFLSGDYCDLLRRRGETVPGWAQLNSLAHGNFKIVRRVQRRSATRRLVSYADRADQTWRGAQRMLANDVIELVEDDPEMLSYVQRHALVPLEFRLMGERGLTAYELVQFTRDALRSSIR